MKKLIMTLLSVSLTTTCFATEQAVWLDDGSSSTAYVASSSSIAQRFTHTADRFAEDIFDVRSMDYKLDSYFTAAAGSGAEFPQLSNSRLRDLFPELPRLDYLFSHR